jgi:SRSO17 transposase
MSRIPLLERPEAKILLDDARVSPELVTSCGMQLHCFLQRYLPLFYREEQRVHARLVIQGRLSDLERKTSEPIARLGGQQRKPVQNFVGAGAWDDEAVMTELRSHVRADIGADNAVLVLDPSGFPKKGTESCGVDRQWCGRLGKVDNCQVGVFWGYVSGKGKALVDRRLYLNETWAKDAKRRQKTHVPKAVIFQEKWRIGLERLDRIGPELPHGWIAADDEFGRVTAFREALRQRGERYVVDVPCNTLIREVTAGGAAGRRPRFERVDAWAGRQPSSRWRKLHVADGEKGEHVVRALTALVQAKDEAGRVGPSERVLVIRNVNREPRTWYALSNDKDEKLEVLTRVKCQRHGIEELLQDGNGEVGLDHYEVRSWVGWHHHMTLSIVALWFLVVERKRAGKKNAGHHGGADAGDIRAAAS